MVVPADGAGFDTLGPGAGGGLTGGPPVSLRSLGPSDVVFTATVGPSVLLVVGSSGFTLFKRMRATLTMTNMANTIA